MCDDENYEIDDAGDAGASSTYPTEAGGIRKGGYICVKGRPCKVVDVSTSKTGKHGHAKCHFVCIDIFTAKKMEELCPASHNATVPVVTRVDYQVVDCASADPGDALSLMTEAGEIVDSFNMPPDQDLCTQIFDLFQGELDVFVTVTQAMEQAQIMAVKTGLDQN
eukprot:TRINITY_DN1383_c0_g1_i1.p1 TRINITY_DN1383_c0_g1~~TRINITY_DN1383_c0_g1_i1.p1  ORF type:complete len:165 (+),score=64.94 TRINITY_DN1383_c0_g1_i1:225-719(+)